MSPAARFWRGLVPLALIVIGSIALTVLAVWNDLEPPQRELLWPMLLPRIPLVVVIALGAAGVLVLWWRGQFAGYVQRPLQLAEEVQLIASGRPEARLSGAVPEHLRALADSIDALAEQREQLQHTLMARVDEARADAERERNRLGALVADLEQAVLVCNREGRILLYNHRARLQFAALAPEPGGTALVGLGRSVFRVLDRAHIQHALERIQQQLRRAGAQAVASFVTTSRKGHMVRVRMAPVLDGEGAPAAMAGYVLTLDNLTRDFDTETRRDALIQALGDTSQSTLASLRKLLHDLAHEPQMPAALAQRCERCAEQTLLDAQSRLDGLLACLADELRQRWPLEEMQGEDLIQAAQRRIGERVGLLTKEEEVDGGLWLRTDSLSLLQGLTYIARRLSDEYSVRELRLRLRAVEGEAHLELIFSGVVVGSEALASWELDPMSLGGESTPLNLREVMARHGGRISAERDKTQQRTLFRLVLPLAAQRPEVDPSGFGAVAGSRPEFFDFSLLHAMDAASALDDLPLAELAYTVFDTETTGLRPSEGDEIIQIGATRIVAGRMLAGESFDQLIDPQRALDPASARIHGITPDMLAGQPVAAQVLPEFHAYCADTVLVAHNAAFDLRFLQMKEAALGLRFDHPVLDTLLLSAVVHPHQESHRLEAIAQRLGVPIVGRHNALGDAMATAEIFLRMIPLLQAQGIHTLRQAREASARTGFASLTY